MKKTLYLAVVALLLTAPIARAQLGTTTGTTTVNVTVAAEAALSVGATTNLASVGTNFSSYTGTTSLTYFIRTTLAGGSGFIKLEVTTDFAPAGGPSVGTPPTAGDALNYTCTVANPGNNGAAIPCGSPTTSSTTAQTSVATFGTDNRSLIGGNSASVAWTLTNDPKYKTGAYSAVVTFTISAS
ncbi:MAG: hypothetical protein ABSF45_20225 [Terriglobia bacterium]|jgi:hypothetical protein